jgi:glycosyltransferase involved in cell wall biosynthesis
MKKNRKTISLVVPMRNESKGIQQLLVSLQEFEIEMQKRELNLEIIVVDNHSIDNSIELHAYLHLREKNYFFINYIISLIDDLSFN